MYNGNGDSSSLQEVRYEHRKRGNIPFSLRAFDRLPIISIQGWNVLPVKYLGGKAAPGFFLFSKSPPDQICICIFSGNMGAFVCLFFSFNMWNQFPVHYPIGVSAPRGLLISYQTKRFNDNAIIILRIWLLLSFDVWFKILISHCHFFPHLLSKVKFGFIITFILTVTQMSYSKMTQEGKPQF